MKLLTASTLLCAMICALSTAADEGGRDGRKGSTKPEHLDEKKKWSGWTRYGNQYYHYFPNQTTWAQAEKFCVYKNANLASVHSLREYQAIQNIIYRATNGYDPTWIGGSAGYWFWSDGTPFTYANWCPGEPDDFIGEEKCLHMNWIDLRCMNDIPCSGLYPFICASRRE